MSRTDWRKTLDAIVASLNELGSRNEYEFGRLRSAVGPVDSAKLRDELARLVSTGRIVPRYRVRSEVTGAGLHDYSSIMDIPNRVYDETVGRYQQVDPTRDIEIIYTGARR